MGCTPESFWGMGFEDEVGGDDPFDAALAEYRADVATPAPPRPHPYVAVESQPIVSYAPRATRGDAARRGMARHGDAPSAAPPCVAGLSLSSQ